MHAQDGRLTESEVDALLLRVHRELQRLSEELQLPRRLAEWLNSEVQRLANQTGPIRIVDVGCGLGYVSRWLAARRVLAPGIELVGVDLNRVLVEEASALAGAEGLSCRFVVGDAFAPGVAIDDPARTIVVSTGLLHHFDPDELVGFFAAQQELRIAAFAHWDIDPSGWSAVGAWVFHQARMRERVSRHDGVLSARRAHMASTLEAAAQAGAPDYRISCRDGPRWRPALSEVLRPIVGYLAAN
jgi:SAM-dependent methyltransferase